MKKAFLRVLTVLMLVCFGAAVFTACGENEPPAETVYKLTYTANGGVGADKTEEHKEGDALTLKGADTFTRDGYTLTAWKDGDKSYAPGAAFTMPAKDVRLAAQWTENGEEPPVTTYTVTVTGDHAKATFDKQGPYKEGDVVKFSVAVDQGYDLVSVKNGSDTLTAGADGKYSVTVAKANITVTVETKKHEEVPPPVTDTYTVTVTGDHATATFDKQGPYKEGDVVKFSVAVDQGYDLVSVKNGGETLNADGEGKYSVTVAKENITITVETKVHEEVPPQGTQITGYANANMVSDNNGTSFQLYLRVKQSGYQNGAAMKDDLKLVIGTKEIACESVNDPGEGSDIYVVMFRINKADLTIESGANAEVTLKCADKTYTCPATTVDEPQKSVLLGNDEYTLKIEDGKLVLAYEQKTEVVKSVTFAGTAFVREGDTEKIYIAINLTAQGYTEEEIKAAKLKIGSLEFSAIPERSGSTVLYYFITGETPTAATLAAGKYAVSLELDGASYKCPTVQEGQIQEPIVLGSRTYTLKTEGADTDKALYLDIAGEAEAQKYSVTVNGNVDVVFDVEGPYADGTEVKFTVTAKAGYKLVSVKNGGETLQAGTDGKYSVTIDKADVVITAETQAEGVAAPVFTFEKGDATGEDPEIELGEKNDKGVYSVKLPESPYTAPANKYFRGWEIGGVTYYPAETYDVKDGDTVTLTAVWEDRVVKTVEENATIGTWNPNTIPHGYVLAENQPVVLTGEYETLSVADENIWDGYVVEIVRPGDDSYFVRPDGVALLASSFTWAPAGTSVEGVPGEAEYKAAKLAGPTTITVTLADSTVTVVTAVGSHTITAKITGMTLDSYVVNFAVDDATAKNAKVEYYRMYETPAISGETSLTIGVEGNTVAYTGNNPVWKSLLRKGEKLVLSGTMTSVANATTAGNYNAILAYLYSGLAPVAAIRSDDYIVDEAKMLAAENMQVAHTPAVQNADKHTAVSEIENDSNFWASMRAIISDCTAEITFDYTDAAKIVITFVYTGDDNKFTETYTFTATEGNALKDEYTIGLGGDHNYTVINSLKRTSVKAAKEEATQMEWGEETMVKERPETWYYWHQNGNVTTNTLDAANKSFTLTYEMGDKLWYGFQVFYKDPACQEGSWYKISLDVKVDKDCTITINKSEVDLTANESKHVEIYYIQSDLASLSIQMGVAATDERVESATLTVSDVAWEAASEPQNTPIAAPTAFTVEDHTVSVTPDPSNGGKGRPVYEIGFFQGEECRNTVRVKDGGEIDVTKIANGAYTLKIRQLAVSGNGASDWSTVTVENFTVANEISESYDMELQGEANALDGKWYYWNEHGETKEAKYDHGTVTVRFDGNTSNWYGVQLFWKNLEFATDEKYDLTMKITSTAAGKITVNGTVVELEESVAKEVSLSNLTQGTQATVSIQMGVQNPDSKLEAATVTITEIEVSKAAPFVPPAGEVRTIVPSATECYGETYVGLSMTAEEFRVIESADKVQVNSNYTGIDWQNKGFEAVGDVGGGIYRVNVRISDTKATPGEYVMNWMKGDAVIATYTYTLSA